MAKLEFNLALKRFAEKMDIKTDKLAKRVTFDLLNRISLKTPVLSGRARASWNIGVDKLDLSVKPPDYMASNAVEAISRGASRLSGAEEFKTLFISNNLPYIRPLEFGHSDQAPRGMVRISIAEVKAELRASASS